MPWNRDKWNQFVSDSTKVPPTDAAAKAAAEEANALAETHEEEIDLDALGVARVKTMLEELAAATPSEQGPAGNDGALAPAAFNGISTPQKHTFTNTGFPATGDTQIVTVYDFAPNELDGSKDTILVHYTVFGCDTIGAYWTPTGEPPVQILGFAGNGVTTVAGGTGQIFINEAAAVFDGPFSRSLATLIEVGIIPTGNQKATQIVDNGGSGIPSWMVYGGKLELQIKSLAASQTFGIMV